MSLTCVTAKLNNNFKLLAFIFMLLAHIVKDLKNQNWLALISDFIVVVAGILVAMQLASWEEKISEKKLADEYAVLLFDDLKIDQKSAEITEAYYNQVQEFGKKALNLWAKQTELSPTEILISFYQASNILANNSAIGAYNALSSTGRLGLIGGPKLASKLSSYYAQDLDDIIYQQTPFRMEIRGILPIAVQLAIRHKCNRFVPGIILQEELTNDCDIGIENNEVIKLLDILKAHPKMSFYLRQKIMQDDLAVSILKLRKEDSQELQTLLESSLNNQ